MLIEGDPHQILEGVLISAYALQVSQAFIYLRGEFALGLERLQQAVNDAYAHGAVGTNIFGSGFSIDVVVHPGAGAYICGEETGAARVARGQARLPAHQAAVLPRRHRPLRRAHRGQQRRDDGQHPVDREQRWRRRSRPSAPAARRGPGCSRWRPTFAIPATTSSRWSRRPSATSSTPPVLGGGIRGSNTLKAFIPGGVSAPWFGPDQVDLPLGPGRGGRRRLHARLGLHRGHGLGHLRGPRRVAASPSSSPASRAGSARRAAKGRAWLERILYRIENGSGREEDLDLLMDLCDNISPGVAWPPQQTTICVLGPSIPRPSPRASACSDDEFLVHIKDGGAPLTDTAQSKPLNRQDRRAHVHAGMAVP